MTNQKIENSDLIRMIASALAGLDTILTDADECAASVKAAKNLSILGQRLSVQNTHILNGSLWLNKTQSYAAVASIDGSVELKDRNVPIELPEDAEFYFQFFFNGQCYELPVTYYPALSFGDESRCVIEDPTMIYDIFLNDI